MQSSATTVDAYLAEVPDDRRDALLQLRSLCLEVMAGYDEAMAYGMPTYAKDGKIEVAFASQKHTINLYCLKESVVKGHPELLEGLSVGKGCIRFRRPQAMDFVRIRALLQATVDATDRPC